MSEWKSEERDVLDRRATSLAPEPLTRASALAHVTAFLLPFALGLLDSSEQSTGLSVLILVVG